MVHAHKLLFPSNPSLDWATRANFLCGANMLAIGGHLPAFWVIFSLRMRRNSYFQAFGQNADKTRFSDPDFLIESNNFAIR